MASEGAAAETAASPSKQSWAQARDSSHQLVLQTALEDLEAQAVKLRQERDDFKVKSEQQDEEAATLKRKIQELQAQVSSKESEAFETTQEAKTRLEQAKILEDDSKSKLERSDRLEKEADALREEISRLTKANAELKGQITSMETDKKLDGSEVAPLRYQAQRLQSEVDATASHSKWLETQLQTKNELMADLKTTQASELAHLRATSDYIVSKHHSRFMFDCWLC